MTIWFVGECKRCGDCCRIFVYRCPTTEEVGVCRYLREDNLCELHLLTEADRESVATAPEIEWFKENCLGFPRYMERQDEEAVLTLLKKVGWPTKNCGYKLIVEDFDG